ncbi:hypothetical protein [Nocardiopsis ganjiahuensis]|uniref:hypothetical protein n=1 Tax=Nocardiopsis ganjiahuensis TaxID=239984 RepID=UPI0003693EC2|nr:hypothetical protein [Nocardiopsis ganjiahuensis]
MLLTRWAPVALAIVLALVLTAAAPAVGPRGGPLDGFTIGHLPARVGTETSTMDSHYEWEDVSFTARFWEQAKEGGGFQVVLQVLVLRGEELTDLAAVRSFLAEYHERDPDTWELEDFDNHGTGGLYGGSEAFWTPQPGVAVEVRDPFGLIGEEELLATARGIGPENPA